MKNKIFGITVLLAVFVFGFTFTACPPAEDNDERVVSFYNASAAKIVVTCAGSSPGFFELDKALSTSADDITGPQVVTRKGKDIEITSITSVDYSLGSDWWNYITIRGSATGAPGGLKGGTIIFEGVKTNGIIPYKIDTIPLDE